MNIRIKVASIVLMAIALCGSAPTYAIDRTQYADAVLNILRLQVALLEELAVSPRFKYSDNLVRSAIAIERTFGLLGPMEWHAVQATKIRSEYQGDDANLDEDRFAGLARASQRSLKELVRTAHEVMENQDPKPDILLTAIKEMQQSCDNCHSLLPNSVAPDLWGPLQRK